MLIHIHSYVVDHCRSILCNIYIYWLVVSTPLKNICQMGVLFPIYGKIKHVPNHQPDYTICFLTIACEIIS